VRDDVTSVAELSLTSTDSGDVLSYRANWENSPNRDLAYRLDRGNGWIRDRRIAGGAATNLNLWYSETRFLDSETFLTVYTAGAPTTDATNDIFIARQQFAPAYAISGSVEPAAEGAETTIEYMLTNRGDVAGAASVTVEIRSRAPRWPAGRMNRLR
jgi:hypothetical protein